jgi:enoyl-CoA hydratase/carnithine racemase
VSNRSQFEPNEVSEAFWRYTFNHPPFNLIDGDTILELQEIVQEIEASRTLKIVVFDSANPDYFFARYDRSRAGGSTARPTWSRRAMRSASW